MKTHRMRDLQISDRMTMRSPNLARYFVDVNSTSLLTGEEEFALSTRAIAGDEAAVDLLVKHNLRFVISVAKQYGLSPDILSDLICQGNIGLVKAARTFDPTRGFKFISYAVWHIRSEIFKYFDANHRTVRIPGNAQTKINKARKVEADLRVTLDRDATTYEIVEELLNQGISIEPYDLDHITGVMNGHTALESEDGDVLAPIDWLTSDDNPPDNNLLDDDKMAKILRLLDTLREIERAVVCARIGLYTGGEGEAFKDISARFDRSTEWSRLVYNKALRRLKMNARKLSITENN